jgi:hypothetical protein
MMIFLRRLKAFSFLVCFIAVAINSNAQAFCWDSASRAYGIPVDVLQAIAQTESSFNANARNRNGNGSSDAGLMQINSSWLPALKRYGITAQSLKDPCTNLKVGAWILANNAKKFGWNWTAIGAYNVGCAKLEKRECAKRRNTYAWKIHRALQQTRRFRDTSIPPPNMPTYGQEVTAATDRLARDHVPASGDHDAKGIVVVRFGEPSSKASPASIGDMGNGKGAGFSGVGAFLNYDSPRSRADNAP